jgi:glutaminase
MLKDFTLEDFTLKTDLQLWLRLAKQQASKGKLPSYIPLLAQVNSETIAIAIQSIKGNLVKGDLVKGDLVMAGDTDATFPLMSVIKPFLLLYVLENFGEAEVFRIVDSKPSADPFNAIPEDKPKNPMINSGAIAIASLLTTCEELQNWLNQRSEANLTLDLAMLDSVRSVTNRRNLAIADQLKSLGIIDNQNQALAIYEEICCLRGNVQDLAKIGTLLIDPLVDKGRSPYISMVLRIMTECGMYEASPEFAQDIGMPSKSSVSGALLSIVPNEYAIACYSPALDAIGNSVAGLFLMRQFKSHYLDLIKLRTPRI